MSGLAHLFSEIAEGLNRAGSDEFSGISGSRKGKPERHAIDNEGFSEISGISGKLEGVTEFPDDESTQARARVCAGAPARVLLEKAPEMPETPEKPEPAEGWLSGSLSLKPEKPEKSERAALLRAALARLSPEDRAAFDEQAGFLEYECGLPRAEAEQQALREWRHGLTVSTPTETRLPDRDALALWRAGFGRIKLHDAPCPGYRHGEWPLVYARAASFLDNFGEQAEALGWTASRLFGVHPQAGIVRVDACGALVLPGAGPVLAITANEIRFAHLTHREKPGQPKGVPLWEVGVPAWVPSCGARRA